MLTSLMVKKAVPQQKVVDSFIRIAQMMLCCGEEIESFVSGSRVFLFLATNARRLDHITNGILMGPRCQSTRLPRKGAVNIGSQDRLLGPAFRTHTKKIKSIASGGNLYLSWHGTVTCQRSTYKPSSILLHPPDSAYNLLTHPSSSCILYLLVLLFGKKRAMQLVRHLRGDQHIFVKTVTGIVITVWVRRRDKIAALKCKLRSQAL